MRGVLAGFATEHALRHALECLMAEQVKGVETYTPVALNENPTGSPLPLVMFVAGVLGFVGFFALMAYADIWAYPLDIGGRPNFAWPSFVPIAFELGVLCAMAAGFFGYFLICRMPRLYDPIDECDNFRRASRDGWFVAVRSTDAQLIARAWAALDGLRPASIEEFSS
jgi:hypothetical protein